MSLSRYNEKRNFNVTPEPGGKKAKASASRSFVIQRHKASRLHYDFRLEVNGVLKSWAIPRGPSLNPTDKRLSVMVEDHPLAYASFSGVIPDGNYGAGIVEIWDKGTYEPEEMDKISDKEIDRHINAGMLKFYLKGKKIKGSFALVRIDGKNWLLIKHRDQFATDKPYNSEEHTLKSSPINKALAEAATAKRSSRTGRRSSVSSSGEGNGKTRKSISKASAGTGSSTRKAAGENSGGTKNRVAKKSAGNRSAAEKSALKKSAGSRSAAKKSAVKKSAGSRSAAKKSAPKKSAGNRSATKKFAAKKSAGNRFATKKSAAKKSTRKTSTAK